MKVQLSPTKKFKKLNISFWQKCVKILLYYSHSCRWVRLLLHLELMYHLNWYCHKILEEWLIQNSFTTFHWLPNIRSPAKWYTLSSVISDHRDQHQKSINRSDSTAKYVIGSHDTSLQTIHGLLFQLSQNTNCFSGFDSFIIHVATNNKNESNMGEMKSLFFNPIAVIRKFFP